MAIITHTKQTKSLIFIVVPQKCEVYAHVQSEISQYHSQFTDQVSQGKNCTFHFFSFLRILGIPLGK